jgi:hypothetical protein
VPRLHGSKAALTIALLALVSSRPALAQDAAPAAPSEPAVEKPADVASASPAALAREAQAAGRHREACEYFALALASLPSTASDAERDPLQSGLAESKKHVATIVVRLDEGVASANLVLDGKPAGTFPQRRPLYADPGRHTLTAEATGRQFSIVAFEVAAGKNVIVPLPEKGRVPPPAIDKPIWPTIVMASVAGVGLAVGVGTLAGSFARESEATDLGEDIGRCNLDALSGACLELSSVVSERNQLRDASTVAFAASGVALGALIAYVLIPAPGSDPEAPPPVQQALRSISIMPAVSDAGAVFSIRGAF